MKQIISSLDFIKVWDFDKVCAIIYSFSIGVMGAVRAVGAIGIVRALLTIKLLFVYIPNLFGVTQRRCIGCVRQRLLFGLAIWLFHRNRGRGILSIR